MHDAIDPAAAPLPPRRPRRSLVWLWRILFVAVGILTVVDWLNGYTAKTLSSTALLAALGLLAFRVPHQNRRMWLLVFVFLAIATAALAYRLARWIGTGT